jgi:hypothetical protein
VFPLMLSLWSASCSKCREGNREKVYWALWRPVGKGQHSKPHAPVRQVIVYSPQLRCRVLSDDDNCPERNSGIADDANILFYPAFRLAPVYGEPHTGDHVEGNADLDPVLLQEIDLRAANTE